MRVAVIGGGPAGAEAARRLAEAGARTVLYDTSFDREKPCGGGVPWRGRSEFFDRSASEIPAAEIREVLFESPSGATALVPLPEPLRIYSRRTLDRAWAERARRAGAQLRTDKVVEIRSANATAAEVRGAGTTSRGDRVSDGSSFRGTSADAGGGTGRDAPSPAPERAVSLFRVRTAGGAEEAFDAIVGADGVNSLVRRTFSAPFEAVDLSQAVGVYVPGKTGSTARLAFAEGIAGYLWSFPRTDHLAVGACAPLGPGGAAVLRRSLAAWLGRIDAGGESSSLPSYSALIPSLTPAGLASNRVSGPGWCLVGDAAGSVDPLTREGILWGLRSSASAVPALLDGRPERYPAEWDRSHGAELRWAAARRDRFFETEMTDRLVRILEASSSVRQVMADLILGRQGYLTLKRRLLGVAVPVAMQWFLRRLGA